MTTATPVERLRGQLDNVKTSGSGFTARCPAHDDRHNSLKIDESNDGRCLVHCYAGCDLDAILKTLDWTVADLFPPQEPTVRQNGHARRIVATYDYCDEAGTLLYQVVRFDPKGFQQRRPDGRGGWVWSLGGVRRVLYCLPELLAADPDEPVLLGEGEKDQERLRKAGCVATTHAGGVGNTDKALPLYTEALRDRHVVILPDNDEAGRKHAETVAQALNGVAASVRVLMLPGLPPKGDVSDWLDAGGDTAQLRALIDEAPAWTPSDPEETAQDTSPQTAPDFPIEALPPAIRAYVEAAAESIPVPVEMIAVPLIGGAAALIGNRLHLALKPSYREYLSLYLALVMPPGTAKSPALKLALWPLDVLQRGAMKDYREKIATYDSDLDRWKARKPEERGGEAGQADTPPLLQLQPDS